MKKKFSSFYTEVMRHHNRAGRALLPWRKNQTPYRVVVSELMLQQTQTARVVPFFQHWMKQFPTWKKLHEAPQSEVLRAWKGLGYNSRALRLHTLAHEITLKYKGKLPSDYHTLLTLPGIGPYTAGAICAFAYNTWVPLIETNIRRVFIHHFFKGKENVTDKEILEVMNEMGEVSESRAWYEALMDYGSELPKQIKKNPNTKSKHYTKQKTFKGSDREIRGKVLDILLKNKKISEKKLFSLLGDEPERYQKIISDLEKENFLKRNKKSITLK